MATKKITELTELTTPNASDVLAIVDVGADITKKITTSNFQAGLQSQINAKIAQYDGATYDVTALAAVSQAEYDAIGTKSATTLYFII